MVTLPFSIGPADDWDPQGYEEEEEDTLAPGMHLMNDEDEDDDDLDDDEEIEDDEDADDEEGEDDEEDELGFDGLEKNAIEELEELEDIVTRSERETLKLSDFTDEE
ncbi:MAG: hypothetical protein ACOYUZ_01725 [Patescibacteria group bacterium]